MPARVCTGEENAPYQGTHNIAAERALRAVALGRKNYLFAGSDAGGDRAAAIYWLIGSAKLNGLDPEHYLRTVLARVADHSVKQIAELLPWNLVSVSFWPSGPNGEVQRSSSVERCKAATAEERIWNRRFSR